MNKCYFLLIFLLVSKITQSQSLLNLIENHLTDYKTDRSIKHIIETFSENSEKTIFNQNQQLMSKRPINLISQFFFQFIGNTKTL